MEEKSLYQIGIEERRNMEDKLRQEQCDWPKNCIGCAEQARLLAERDAQLAAVIETARKAWRYWDIDQDSKVGKCLAAICGCNGIIPEIDEAFKATRQPTQDKE